MTAEESLALVLIDEARLLIRAGQTERAVWRLVDAAVLARDAFRARGGGSLTGFDEVTGRGARVVVVEINETEDVTA